MENNLFVKESVNAVVNTDSVDFFNAALKAARKYLIQKGCQNVWYFDDVAQESGMKIWKYRYSFDPERGVGAIEQWASVIASHCLEDFRKMEDPNYRTRKEAVDNKYSNTIYDMEDPEYAANPVYHKLKQPITICVIDQAVLDDEGYIVGYCYENECPVWDNPESLYVNNEKYQAVMERIGRLNPRRQAALMMSVDGFTRSEIAQAMGCSEQAVYNLLTNGRKQLVKMIKDDGVIAA